MYNRAGSIGVGKTSPPPPQVLGLVEIQDRDLGVLGAEVAQRCSSSGRVPGVSELKRKEKESDEIRKM